MANVAAQWAWLECPGPGLVPINREGSDGARVVIEVAGDVVTRFGTVFPPDGKERGGRA